ncbi:TetR/AcrR family transcriptional regulator [Kribbella deserti]|uniref:TetR/AcrR family transcriptional regulator n=1 Tax=Kribbella deserti TaxID=1926257 RepID=A0ABV6QHY4_9ACTN
MSTAAAPGVGRRKPSKGDLTSQAILAHAERLLAEHDITEITIDGLTAGAGISRSAFYFHFESREAVLRQLAEKVVAELFEAAAVWLDGPIGDQPTDQVRRGLAATVAVWRRHGPVLRGAVRARDIDPEIRRFWAETGRRLLTAVTARIEAERAAGIALDGPPAKALATVLIAMNDEVCFHHSRAKRSAAADREVVDTLATVWLRTLYGG